MAAARDGASSSSFSTSGSSANYDVFLNFRGEDTRNNFTGFLHKALERERIKGFIDSEDLRGGEEIQPALLKAIQQSKISIPIFSKGYADSKWCLMELVEIVRCHRLKGQKVLPIFLDVKPKDVRHQTGSFEGSFEKHKEQFNAQAIESWKDALADVGGKKGFELQQVNGNQSNLVDLVVDWALSELNSNLLGDVKYPVGLEARVQDLLSLLDVGSNNIDVRVVGICGIGGVGKTTIAIALYNNVVQNFKTSIFLANVREEASRQNGSVSLQQNLIYSVSNKKVEICNVYEGQRLVKERLQGKKVLLVLDDVNSYSQLTDLAFEFNWFGPGSRIIITSRDEHILKLAKVDEIYWPREFDDEQSLQLFSLHAFSRDRPPKDYEQLSQDMVRLAGGLPLTLKVLGSSLFDIRDKEVWRSKIQKLKTVPDKEVLKILKISYDDLEDEEKSIFLDAACFFVGWTKETVISIWDACGFNSMSAIKKLTQRSLLKFPNKISYGSVVGYSDKKIVMHDQIQAMGRDIVFEENRMEPWKRSRVWHHEEILDVLEEHQGTKKLEGLILSFDYNLSNSVCLHKGVFAMMPNLRFLNIQEAHYEGDFPHLPSNLRWLSWENSPLEIVQDNFYHKKLVHMNLSKSQITKAWTKKPHNEYQWFQKLKVLRLQMSFHLSESPDFSWFPNLETLDLRLCKKLVNLHKSIGDLNSLAELDLFGTKIEELPDSICKLGYLKHLILGKCSLLKKLPKSIGDLKSLVELDLSGTKIEELPASVWRLNSLEKLDLNGCKLLNKLPKLPSTLTHLAVHSCISLQNLPDLSSLKNMRELRLHNCKKLENIRGLGGIESLEELSMYECDTIESLQGLPSALTHLAVEGCSSLQKLPDLSSLKNLRELELRMCKKLEEIRGLEGTESLEKLSIYECDTIDSLPKLPSSLTHLVVGNLSFQKLPDLSSLKNLRKLHLFYCRKLEEIGGLEGIESLEELYVYDCNTIKSIPKLPSTLAHLVVESCISLQKLPDLSNLKNLRRLRLINCKKLEKIQGLEEARFFGEFSMYGCSKLTDTSKTHGQKDERMSNEINEPQPPTNAEMLRASKRGMWSIRSLISHCLRCQNQSGSDGPVPKQEKLGENE